MTDDCTIIGLDYPGNLNEKPVVAMQMQSECASEKTL